jgi:hypothetical protein
LVSGAKVLVNRQVLKNAARRQIEVEEEVRGIPGKRPIPYRCADYCTRLNQRSLGTTRKVLLRPGHAEPIQVQRYVVGCYRNAADAIWNYQIAGKLVAPRLRDDIRETARSHDSRLVDENLAVRRESTGWQQKGCEGEESRFHFVVIQ